MAKILLEQGEDLREGKSHTHRRARARWLIPINARWKIAFDTWMTLLVGFSCFSTAY